ncbi:MAG: decarboxylating 6-phosphogluconate dehydrogenase [Gemmatimonadota bacterium]|nr:decarboxylating 6-phosphogluconate dehydrogenase [Gemmatimonadota bacterium]
MHLAMIGLGKMGGNMSERLLRGGHAVVVHDRDPAAAVPLEKLGGSVATSLDGIVGALEQPRIIWMMIPSGKPVDATIDSLVPKLARGDILIDGGNSNFKDSMRRAAALAEQGIEFMDCGTSGGIWGLANGYCLMIGGTDEAFAKCEPIFKTLAPADGYAHVGQSGAGHYVKMIHNGIEYGMLQAYAEGYELLHATPHFELDLKSIASLWNHGSVVRSWLNELAESAFGKDAALADIRGYVEDSGEGRWTIQEAIDINVPAPVITLSLLMRLRSRQQDSFSAKVIAALRNEFGGHAVKKA